MSTKEGTVRGGIIKLVLFSAFIIIMGYLSFMAIYPGIKSINENRQANAEQRAKEELITSLIEITYIGGSIDTIEAQGKSFYIETYKQAVPVLKKSLFGGNVAVNVQSFKIIEQK